MRVAPEQLDAQLARGLAAVYVVWGDELLALEAADAIRAAARQAGYDDRETMVALAGFDWQQVRAAGANLSLFGGRKLVDLRIPTGKPGVEGAQVLKACAEAANADTLLLVSLPDLGWQEEKAVWLTALVEAGVGVKAAAPAPGELPAWIAARLRRQQQSADPDTLRFLAERVQGNLLAAQQEILKLGMLLPPGPLAPDVVRQAVVDVARYDLDDLRNALLTGDLAACARTLEGLRQEGEALPLVQWAIGEELRTLLTLAHGRAGGAPVDALLREARVFGPRQALVKRALARVDVDGLTAAMRTLAGVDRMIKGLARGDPWTALLKLVADLAPRK